jgi:hypothetical protein
MQKLLPDGNDLVSKDRQAHHRVAELLYKLQEKSTSEADFPQTFSEVMDELRPHLRDEEETDIPELEGKLSREESAALAKQFSKTKKLAPTRSHPYATSFEPPFETALALMTAPIDKVPPRERGELMVGYGFVSFISGGGLEGQVDAD